MPPRIFLDGRFSAAGYPGINRYVQGLAQALAGVVTDSELWMLTAVGEGASAALRAFEVDATARSWREQWLVPQSLRRGQAQLFHSPYFWTAGTLPGRTLPCPLVVTIHDLIGLESELLPSPWVRFVVGWGLRRVCRCARLVLTPSRASQQDLLAHFRLAPAHVVVTPYGVDARFAPASGAACADLRARYELNRPYVLFVGSHKPHKNLVGLIRAWAELPPALRAAQDLVLAGSLDSRYPQARDLVRRLDLPGIRWLGRIPETDLPALLSGATLLVVPSLAEGFGLPVLEAMACGTPVACSQVAGLPEAAGRAAAYFNPTQTSSITATLARLLSSPEERHELEQRGLARARAFSWQKTAELTFAAYRTVLGLTANSPPTCAV